MSSDRPPIIRRRRTGCYSVLDRVTEGLIGTVQREPTGWWVAFDDRGDRVGPRRSTLPALYSTRRLAVRDLLDTRKDSPDEQ